MSLCSLVEKLCTKEENVKTGCNFNFGHECNSIVAFYDVFIPNAFSCTVKARCFFLLMRASVFLLNCSLVIQTFEFHIPGKSELFFLGGRGR